jgi:hypothetical protein
MKVRLVRCIAALAAACAFCAIAAAPGKAEPLSDSDRQALREFRINRLFAALGYLEQQGATRAFPFDKAGFGEMGNAWSGINEAGRRQPQVIQDLIRDHESRHGILQALRTGIASLFLGTYRSLAATELDHDAEDLRRIDALLANEPDPTEEELQQLRAHEARLLERFKPHIPGLVQLGGGFVSGGSYRSDRIPKPGENRYLSKYISVPPEALVRTEVSKEEAARAQALRAKRLQQAREARARAYALAEFLRNAQGRVAACFEATKRPLRDANLARADVDAAMVIVSPAARAYRDTFETVGRVKTDAERLQKAYLAMVAVRDDASRRTGTICGYAQRSAKATTDQVRAWQSEAGRWIQSAANAVQRGKKEIDLARTALDQHRKELSERVALQRRAYEAGGKLVASFRALAEAQARVKAALRQADGFRGEMVKAHRELRALKQAAGESARGLAAGDEIARVAAQITALVDGVKDPDKTVSDLRGPVDGRGGVSEIAALDLERYRGAAQQAQSIDFKRLASDAQDALADAEAVQVVGQDRVRQTMEALEKVRRCYANIKGGIPPKPPVVDLRKIDLSGTWEGGGSKLIIRGSAASGIKATYIRPSDNCRHEATLSLKQVTEKGHLLFAGTFVDVEKHCCGQQGIVEYVFTGPKDLSTKAAWWPKGKPRPSNVRLPARWSEFHRK